MNISALTIESMLVGTTCAGTTSFTSPATEKTAQFPQILYNKTTHINTSEQKTPDNIPIDTQNDSTNNSSQNFSDTLTKQTEPNVSSKNGITSETKNNSPIPCVATETDTVQLLLAQYSLNIEHGTEEVATIIQSKVGYEPAQMLTNLKEDELPVEGGETDKSVKNNLIPGTDQTQSALKTVSSNIPPNSCATTDSAKAAPNTNNQNNKGENAESTNTSNKNLSPVTAVAQQQSGKEPFPQILTDADSKIAAPAQQQSGKEPLSQILTNVNSKIATPAQQQNGKESLSQILTDVDSKIAAPAQQQNGKESLPQVLTDIDSKTTTAGKKPMIAYTSVVSDIQKTLISADKTPIPKAAVVADNNISAPDEEPVTISRIEVPGGQKTILSTYNDFMPKAPDESNSKIITSEKEIAVQSQTEVTNVQKTSTLNNTQGESDNLYLKNLPFSQVKNPAAAEMPADNKVVTPQQGPTDTQGQQESLSGDMKEQDNNPSGYNIIQNLNIKELQVTDKEPKNQSSSILNNSTEQPNSAQNQITEQTFTAAQATKTAYNSSSSDVSSDVGKQILESIHGLLSRQDESQQITIRLNPPELGKVVIKFQEQQDQITGLLEVTKPQTRYEIEQALPQIIRNLTDSGIQLKRLDVTLTDQPEQQLFREQTSQNGSFQQHSFTEENYHHNQYAYGTDEWFVNEQYMDNNEPQIQLTNNSVNMLI